MKPNEFFELILGLTLSIMFGMFIGGAVNLMLVLIFDPHIILRLVVTIPVIFLSCMLLSGEDIVGGPSIYPETWKSLMMEATVKFVFFFVGAIPTLFISRQFILN